MLKGAKLAAAGHVAFKAIVAQGVKVKLPLVPCAKHLLYPSGGQGWRGSNSVRCGG